jgi:serine-type D-Ala-D-Ala carboxypeptidase (penicillin-binding protein 5/6)
VLEPASPGCAPHTFLAVRIARLRKLACFLTGGLAHFLARVCWFAVPCHSFGDNRLCSNAIAGEPFPGARKVVRATALLDKPFQSERVANQNASIKVLPFNSSMHFPARFLFVFFTFVVSASTISSAAAAQAYVIADAQTGYVLEEQEPRKKLQVGSLTKIATASVVLDWAEQKSGNLNQIVSIPQEAFVGALENKIGFQPGDSITLRDLLYAALVQSDNIAAYTLAHHVGSQLRSLLSSDVGSKFTPVDAFVAQMNALANQLKMERTRFVNPHGIDYKVKPLPYSTAEDMARLTRYAMSKASFRFYVSQKERQISFDRVGHRLNYMLRNTNELLGRIGIDGVKTGQSARAGQCLILYANRESEVVRQGQQETVYPRHLMVVLLGSSNRFGEGTALLQRGWQLYDQWAAAGRLADPKKLL